MMQHSSVVVRGNSINSFFCIVYYMSLADFSNGIAGGGERKGIDFLLICTSAVANDGGINMDSLVSMGGGPGQTT